MIHQCFGLLAQGLAPSTRRVYAAGQRAYFQFCSSFSLPYFPSSEWLLMLFATWLAQTRKLAPSSVSSYIAAIRSWHIDLGAPDPTSGATRLARLLRGIRRSRTSPAFIRLPITNRLMLVLQSALAVPLFDHIMFWAACCTAFFGFLRVSEFTCSGVFVPGRHLGFDDIDWDAAGHYRLFLHTSKTDPFHHGCTILLGPSGHQVCPVAAMSRYLAIRGSTPGPLFICANGTPLSPSMVNAWLRSKGAGVLGNYSSHSFRIGAATSAALAGVPDHVIKILGRWSSDCYVRYIRMPPHVILQVARHILYDIFMVKKRLWSGFVPRIPFSSGAGGWRWRGQFSASFILIHSGWWHGRKSLLPKRQLHRMDFIVSRLAE